MTEEEKIDEIDNKLDKIEDDETTINLLYQKVDLLEDLIQKQQEEIGHWKFAEKVASKDLRRANDKLYIADKQIDLMAEYIIKHGKVATMRHRFCPNEKKEECRTNCNDFTIKTKCIKQYFKNKVEEEK